MGAAQHVDQGEHGPAPLRARDAGRGAASPVELLLPRPRQGVDGAVRRARPGGPARPRRLAVRARRRRDGAGGAGRGRRDRDGRRPRAAARPRSRRRGDHGRRARRVRTLLLLESARRPRRAAGRRVRGARPRLARRARRRPADRHCVRRAALVALLLAGCGAHRQVDRVWRTGDVTIVAQHRLGRPVPEFGRMQYSLVWGGRVLVPASPWPFAEQSVRLADVTGDGRPDALVTVECGDCNHATAIVDVWTDEGGHVQRIYGGSSNIAEGKGGHPWLRAVGKPITETAWGATRGGLLWF